MFEEFSRLFGIKNWKNLLSVADCLQAHEHPSGNYILHPHILETVGSLDYLRRKTLSEIRRGMI